MQVKIKALLVIILLFVSAYNIVNTTLDVVRSSRRLSEVEGDLSKQHEENSKLKGDVSYKSGQQFVEEEARNKLGFIKKGEKMLIPVDGMGSGGSRDVLGDVVSDKEGQGLNERYAVEGVDSGKFYNLRLWLRYFGFSEL